MEHFYDKLGGEEWFDYEDFYKRMVEDFPSGSVFVELGSWKGKSISYLTVECINQNKWNKIYCVDSWDREGLFEIFSSNTEPIKKHITPIKKFTTQAVDDFEDESIDFLFIDADHSYEGVKKDLEDWYPKVKKGGVISGHDYNNPQFEVKKAVNEFFNLNHIKNEKSVWWVNKSHYDDDFSNVRFFIYCSPKTGSTSITQHLQAKYGEDSCRQIHNQHHYNMFYSKALDITQPIIENSKKFKVYVIDSYREPFERSISSFFQNIDDNCPDWQNMSIDDIIETYHKKNGYLYERVHTYKEVWSKFGLSTDIEFDFDRGYHVEELDNITFIKTRLKDAYRWSDIFSHIIGDDIKIGKDNVGDYKLYSGKYIEFKNKLTLPKGFYSLFETETWEEMNKFMTKEEIVDYLNKWRKKVK